MFPNLRAEQARANLNNQDVADYLGMNRLTYESKKKSGRFNVTQIRKLCELFKCDFDYLFAEAKSESA